MDGISSTAVHLSQVPDYLRCGAFYLSLDQGNDEEIPIPSGVLKADLTITNQLDLNHALSSLHFWGVELIPHEIICHVLSSPGVLTDEFESEYPLLRVLQTLQPINDVQNRLNSCISHGSLHLVEYFVNQGCHVDAYGVRLAVQGGQLELVTYLLPKATPQNARKNFELCLVAFQYGHIDCLAHFQSLGYMKGIGAWAVLQREARIMHINALNLETVQYAVQLGRKMNQDLLVSAAKCGDIEVMTYARARGFNMDKNVGYAVAASRNMHCLEYYFHHGGEVHAWATQILQNVIKIGWLEGLRFSFEKTGCLLTRFLAFEAAAHDQLECLQYLHEVGCPWDEHTTLRAAKVGSLRCLQFACEHGCAISPEALKVAQERGFSEVAAFLLSMSS